MRKLEKFAKEYEKLACDWYETVFLEERNIGLITAYEEGFLKAREMAIKLHDDFYGQSTHRVIKLDILGEKGIEI